MNTPHAVRASVSGGVWLIAYVAVAVNVMVAKLVHADVACLVGILLAMPLLAGFLLASRRQPSRAICLVLVSLFFSWLGDWVGDIIEPHVLVKGVFFCVAHLCYIAAFWPFRSNGVMRRPRYLAGYVVVVTLLLMWIPPYAGRLAPALVVYGVVLGVMAVLATGVHPLTGVGGTIFAFSDMAIAVSAFVFPYRFGADGFVMISTYLLAQLMIVLGVVAASPHSPAEHDPARRGQSNKPDLSLTPACPSARKLPSVRVDVRTGMADTRRGVRHLDTAVPAPQHQAPRGVSDHCRLSPEAGIGAATEPQPR
jgi:uncharacterized membrane protein YhhN